MAEPSPVAYEPSQPIRFAPRAERMHVTATPPAPLTVMVGRAAEVAAVCGLLRDPQVRLLTLTGPGGVGKTRLALQVVDQIDGAIADRAVVVPLATITDPSLVDSTIMQALDIRDAGNGGPIQRVASTIGSERLLLVLDNFEHLLDAAGVVVDLLMSCPNLTVLVTSRSVLRLTGEHGFEVPPLALPDPDRPVSLEQLAAFDAVRLFTERAQAVRSSFAVTAENATAIAGICARLDGLPLAIELAAARSNVLSPQAMLTRLGQRLPILTGGPRDAPLRQKTMRNAIVWSHDLLTEEEQIFFRRLSVFAGGFTLDAAECVSRETENGKRHVAESSASRFPSSVSVLDGLDSLVGKSLLHQAESLDGDSRFMMLETVREFGLEQLSESGDSAATQDRHAAWYLQVAEEAWAATFASAEYRKWTLRVAAEHDNLRAALVWFDANGAVESVLRLAAALWPFWYLRGHITEGREWLERSLARAGETSPAYRARAAVGLSQLSLFQGDFDRAVPLAQESLAYYRSTQDTAGVALSLDLLGRVAENTGNDVEAAAIYEEILTQYRSMGDEHHLVMSLVNLADTAYRLGDYDRSEVLTDEALALTRTIDNQHTQAWPLANAAQLALVRGDRDRARALNEEALALHVALGSKVGMADSLTGLAAIAASLGHHEIAASWLGSADALCAAVGVPLLPHHGQYDRTVAAVRTALGDAKYRAAYEAGRQRRVEDAIDEARALLAGQAATPRATPRDARTPLGLTPRELDVLQLLAKGLTDKEIGEALFISWRTAQGHVASILAKLDVSTRAAAAGIAFRDGLISESDQSVS